MAMNDKDNTLIGARGVDAYPGVANPTAASSHTDPLAANFVRVHSLFCRPVTDSFIQGHGPNYGREGCWCLCQL